VQGLDGTTYQPGRIPDMVLPTLSNRRQQGFGVKRLDTCDQTNLSENSMALNAAEPPTEFLRSLLQWQVWGRDSLGRMPQPLAMSTFVCFGLLVKVESRWETALPISPEGFVL
jgi:hypothetical protein